MIFGCNFWLELGILTGDWDWGLGLGIEIGDWDWGGGCDYWLLFFGFDFRL